MKAFGQEIFEANKIIVLPEMRKVDIMNENFDDEFCI